MPCGSAGQRRQTVCPAGQPGGNDGRTGEDRSGSAEPGWGAALAGPDPGSDRLGFSARNIPDGVLAQPVPHRVSDRRRRRLRLVGLPEAEACVDGVLGRIAVTVSHTGMHRCARRQRGTVEGPEGSPSCPCGSAAAPARPCGGCPRDQCPYAGRSGRRMIGSTRSAPEGAAVTTSSDAVIRKTADDLRVPPNLSDYEATCARFTWDEAAAQMPGPRAGCNIAWSAVDRHADGPLRDRPALRFLGAGDATGRIDVTELSYGDLADRVRRFTRVLRDLGIGKGDRLFVFSGRIPELYIAVLGALRNGTVVTPLFSAFGPEPLLTRLELGSAPIRGCSSWARTSGDTAARTP
ncbi:AMP-binding protein [Rhodococcus aetherivorans]